MQRVSAPKWPALDTWLAMLLQRASRLARAPTLLQRTRLPRCAWPASRFSSQPDSEDGLAPVELVNAWMEDETLTDATLWPHRRLELWLYLRNLKGLDLPNFLEGTRHAYVVVQRLMYQRDWDELEPLVSEGCLKAMQETMEHMGSVAQRVQFEEGDIVVQSAVLRKARVLKPPETIFLNGCCELDVHFTADESFQIFNYHTNEAMPPFDGGTRSQESTWRFKGVVSPTEGAAMTDWQLLAIV